MTGALSPDQQRQRRVRRNAWLLTLLAAAFYLGFIVLSVRAAHA